MSPNTNVPIAVFYHVGLLGTWEAVDQEITSELTSSGLLAATDSFVRNECEPETFEFPTIDLLCEFAAKHDAYILYLHTKGVTQPKRSIDDWRACLLHWTVHRWRDCVGKLDAGYDTVGINEMADPIRHYQGNFWWSTAKHIRTLGPVREVEFVPTVSNQSERHKAEFWLLGKEAKAYQPYHHRINPYITRNPKPNYIGRRF
jgi:hypothetical protein